MRHHNVNRKFGREKDQRNALVRSLACSLIEKRKIRTTEAKAKELRPFVEKLVTKARLNNLSTQRLLVMRLGSPSCARQLIKDIAPRYEGRPGGYTRITKLAPRKSDNSSMAFIEFV